MCNAEEPRRGREREALSPAVSTTARHQLHPIHKTPFFLPQRLAPRPERRAFDAILSVYKARQMHSTSKHQQALVGMKRGKKGAAGFPSDVPSRL